MKIRRRFIFSATQIRGLVFSVVLTTGCSVIPKSIENKALPEMPLPVLIQKAGQYIGKTVILGGYLLKMRKINDRTRIVAIQTPLGADYEPKTKNLSQGIMILNYDGDLDPEVYVKDSKITVAGILLGSSATRDFQSPYPYVELELAHIHLWSK